MSVTTVARQARVFEIAGRRAARAIAFLSTTNGDGLRPNERLAYVVIAIRGRRANVDYIAHALGTSTNCARRACLDLEARRLITPAGVAGGVADGWYVSEAVADGLID